MIPYDKSILDHRVESLMADAAQARLIGKRPPSLRQRMVAGAARLRSSGTGGSTADLGVPTLRDYPYPG